MLKLSQLGAIGAIACATLTCAVAQEEEEGGATKNATNLSAFKGNFFGKTVVTANGEKLRGRARIRARFEEDGLSGVFNIQGNVRVEGERVPIRNRHRFRPSGRVALDEVAPAVSDGVKSRGFYTAQPRDVAFTGKFRIDTGSTRIDGTYTSRARISVRRIVRMTYSVTLEGATEPNFIYEFVAEPRSKDE